jgi:small-conductance mechanosensitive channel/CRP-like cAMP-binding protein
MAAPAWILDAALVLGGLAAATGLAVVLQRLIGRSGSESPGAARLFMGRLAPPVSFLAVLLFIKYGPLRAGTGLASYLEAALVFFAAILVIHFCDAVVLGWFALKGRPYPLPHVLRGFILGVLYLAVLISVLKGALGINLTAFLATSAVLTMIIGLALQGVLSNILAGMSLQFAKCFARGDWVKVGDQEGVVVDMNWRETRLQDRQSNVVVLPNSTVAAATIVNFSRPNPRTALALMLKVGFRAPAALVQENLLAAAREVGAVLAEPAPLAYILSYDETGVSYQLKFWVEDYAGKFLITTEVAKRVWYKFRRQGIEVPIALDDKVAEVLRGLRDEDRRESEEAERRRNFADLVRSSFLRRTGGKGAGRLLVPEREVRELAGLVRRRGYAAGEILFRQGDRGESCFVVARGGLRGEIVTEEEGKRYRTEFRVEPGGLFGEMSLVSGMPRTATGIFEKDSELIEIGAEAFGRLLGRNPRLAEVIAAVVSERNRKNQETLSKIKELSAQDLARGLSRKSVLQRLKGLVRLVTKY